MMRKNNQVCPWVTWLGCVSVLKLSSFLKTSFIIGSSCAFFSVAPIMIPLSGLLSGISGSFIVFAMSCIIRCVYTPSFSLHLLAYHIPGLFASLYWACDHYIMRLLPAVICFALFLMHPTGSQAALYACLWCIPVGIFLCAPKSTFLHALGSTFNAHAIGSVIWLYTMPMSADAWLCMIPLVLFERVVFAGGMVLVYTSIMALLPRVSLFKTFFIPRLVITK